MKRSTVLVVLSLATACGGHTTADALIGRPDATSAAAGDGNIVFPVQSNECAGGSCSGDTGYYADAGPPIAVDAAQNCDGYADEGGQDTLGGVCAGPEDCIPRFGLSCCIDSGCVYGQSAIDAFSCPDGDVQLILASNYDQSCQTDSDCVAVAEGNFCNAQVPFSATATISKSAMAQYQADVARTVARTKMSICRGNFSGPFLTGPCCRNGMCQMDNCPLFGIVGDVAMDAAADASDAADAASE